MSQKIISQEVARNEVNLMHFKLINQKENEI